METTRWNRLEYKQTGKAAFLANYWPMVGGILLLLLLMGDFLPTRIHETVTNCMAICQDLALYGPFEVGACRFLLESSPTHKVPFSRVAFGFNANYGNVVLTQFLRRLFNALWFLLLIVPGIIRSLGYFAVPFILAENPHLHYRRVIRLSLDMTQGYKWDIFVTFLSFLGWYLLDVCTLGILGIFYVNPYCYATQAEMYRFLRTRALENGIATLEELPGVQPLPQ